MKRSQNVLWILALIVLALVLTTVSSIAQTSNDPTINEEANACFGNGTLAGTCNSTDADFDGDIDQADADWMWRCGWYLIRVEYDIYNEEVLDGICKEIIEIVIVEEKVDDDDDDDDDDKKTKVTKPRETEEPEIPVEETLLQ